MTAFLLLFLCWFIHFKGCICNWGEISVSPFFLRNFERYPPCQCLIYNSNLTTVVWTSIIRYPCFLLFVFSTVYFHFWFLWKIDSCVFLAYKNNREIIGLSISLGRGEGGLIKDSIHPNYLELIQKQLIKIKVLYTIFS